MRPEYAANKSVGVAPRTVLTPALASAPIALGADYFQPAGFSADRKFAPNLLSNGPSGRVVIQCGEFSKIRFFLAGIMDEGGADDKTFTVRVTLWYPVRTDESGGDSPYAGISAELDVTCGGAQGVDNTALPSGYYLADTIEPSGDAPPFWVALHSPGDNTPAMVEVDTRGAAYCIIDAKESGASSPDHWNCLWGLG